MGKGIGFENTNYCMNHCAGVTQGDHCTVYEIKCPDGAGRVMRYDIFPGLELLKLKFDAGHTTEDRDAQNLISINYCLSGRFECEFSRKDIGVLTPGDLSINLFDGFHGKTSMASYPLGYYEGMSIMIDIDRFSSWLDEESSFLELNISELIRNVLVHRWYRVFPADFELGRLCKSIYESIGYHEIGLVRLQILEVLLALQSKEILYTEDYGYFSSKEIRKAKHVRDKIIQKDYEYVSVERLALEQGLSVTNLQRIFQTLYGTSVYQYRKEHRLEQSALALSGTDRTVTDIALDAGYTSPGKYSLAFKKRYGVSPLAYRKENRNGTF